MAPFESLAIYLAAVAPPAPPPIITTCGLEAPKTIGADIAAVMPAEAEIKCLLLIVIFVPPNT